MDVEYVSVLNLGLVNDYSRLSPSVAEQFVRLGIRAEAHQLLINKDILGVSRVEMNEKYPFLLVCLDLSKYSSIRRDFAEFVDLDHTKELCFEIQFAHQRMVDF
mmetsp:Transcript_24954/g.31124  ORF Transcript_24954/g.31124 Transcript_24954/m.31124 type:complete len:104 (-) Transcript_24954:1723-2034(-)